MVVSKMAFMDSIETECEACGGLRYAGHVLEHQVEGRNIAEVMDFTISKALKWFQGTSVEIRLAPLARVGLGYLRLNQALSTLSGGELRRLRLASYLEEKQGVFIIDEPTDGLHMADTQKMMELFEQMVDAGNSVFLIEHSLDVIRRADHVIELGPGGGNAGGCVIFEGAPEEMLKSNDSVTAAYL